MRYTLFFLGSFIIMNIIDENAWAQTRWTIGTPIVTYWAGPEMTEDAARQMAEGNFNLVWCRAEQLDNAYKFGLRALLYDNLISPESLDVPEKRNQLEALIARVKSHPAMYAYYLKDEPNAVQFPALGKLVAFLRSQDPAHLAYINLFPTYATNEQLGNKGDVVTAYKEHLQQYLNIVKPDLISYDHYHFGATGDGDQYFLNLALIREAALQAGLPFLNIVQACSWTPSMRVPHTAEVRWLVNTSLAYGAQGISYFVYVHRGFKGALATLDGQPTLLYYGLRLVNRDFVAYAEQLQSLKSIAVYHANVKPLPWGAVAFPDEAPICAVESVPLLWGYFGSLSSLPTHFVIVNLDYHKPVSITIKSKQPLEIFRPAQKRWQPFTTPKLHLEAGGARLLRLALK